MGFETALAPQHITLNEMIFYAYVPANEPKDSIHTKQFNNIHFGKEIHSRWLLSASRLFRLCTGF